MKKFPNNRNCCLKSEFYRSDQLEKGKGEIKKQTEEKVKVVAAIQSISYLTTDLAPG